MDPPECPICLQPFNRRLRFSKCPHQICVVCAVRWLCKQNICPLCRVSSESLLVLDSHPDLPPNPASLGALPPKKAPSHETPSNQQPPQTSLCPLDSSKDARVFEKKMSLTELINRYWEHLNAKQKDAEPMEPESGLETLDISVFQENLKSVIDLTGTVQDNLEDFDNHIFYSELYDALGDIQRSNEFYWAGVVERDPEISNQTLASYVEHVFRFLESLNVALEARDTEVIDWLRAGLDDVYYHGYIEYYFRGYEEDFADEPA